MEQNFLQELDRAIMAATINMEEARGIFFDCAENVIQNRQICEDTRLSLLASGVIDGKNEDARKAQLAERMSDKLEALRNAESEERQARFALERTQSTYDMLKLRLRIAELMAKE